MRMPGRLFHLAVCVTAAALLVCPSAVLADDMMEEIASFSLDPGTMVFETKQEGYELDESTRQTVSVMNDGEVPLEFEMPVSENGFVDLDGLEGVTLLPGEEEEFQVSLIEGLKAGEYEDFITVDDVEGAADTQTVNVTFCVEKYITELTAVRFPEKEIEIANGTEKSAAAFGLPAAVELQTTQGTREAAVDWNVLGSSYDPDIAQEQSFELHARVMLPDDISNSALIETEYTVSVKALAREPLKADPEQNTVTGIDGNEKYTTQTRISFQAAGDGMENVHPVPGDTRYCPISWKVLESRPFDKDTYEASFRISEAGGFALTVLFAEQEYDGQTWTPTGQEDKKEVAFNVKEALEGEKTGKGIQTEEGAGRKEETKVALTADRMDIARYLILMASAAMSFLVAYLLKRRTKKEIP